MVERNNFPDGFLFGSAAAAYHFEGAWDRDGKGPAVADVVPNGTRQGRTKHPEPGNLKHRAIEFYDRYKKGSEAGRPADRASHCSHSGRKPPGRGSRDDAHAQRQDLDGADAQRQEPLRDGGRGRQGLRGG